MVNYNSYWSCREQKTYWGNKTNPIDWQNKLMHCFKCNLSKHFVWGCTSFSSGNYINTIMDSDQVRFSLFNVDLCFRTLIYDFKIKMFNLVKETQGKVDLDFAYSKTAVKGIWLNVFFDTLNNWDKWLVVTAESNRTFCCGDGVEVKAIKAVKFPVTLGGVKDVSVYIKADIIKNDFPLLLSHKSMKTAGMLLNFKNDSCRISDRYIKVQRTTSGYYNIPLANMLLRAESLPKIVLCCEVFKKYLWIEKRSKAKNLHRLFAHASKERLISLIRGSRIFHDKEFLELIKDVCNFCSICF